MPKVFATTAIGHEGFRRERQLGIDRIGRRTGAGIADGDGVAVGLGTRRAGQRGRAAGARDILDHDRLPERLCHLLGNRARDDVGGAAGRERHDHGDGAFREVLGVGSGSERKHGSGGCQARHEGFHAAFSRCATRPANRPRPSVQPMMSSTWFSGCGIMPSTLPRSLTMPAIEFGGAVDIGGLVDDAVSRAIAIEHPPLALEPLHRRFIGFVIALAMRDRHADDLTGVVAAGERRI